MKHEITEAQLQTLRAGLRGHPLEAMLLLAMVTGIQRDELRRLTWSQVDLQTGELSLLASKTKNHARCIPLSEEVVSVLRRYALGQGEHERDDHVFLSNEHSALVFPDSTGGEMSITCFLQQWYTVCKQGGLPRLCFHDLRILVWRRLLAQEREAREQRDATTNDCTHEAEGEE